MNVAVLGAGGWGTAIAHLLGENGHAVSLWTRNTELVKAMAGHGQNPRYHPGVPLSRSITPTTSLEEAATGEVIFLGVPVPACRTVLDRLRPFVQSPLVVSLAKGFEPDTLLRISQVIADVLPQCPRAVLTGPNLAGEIIRGLPTPTVAAAEHETWAQTVQQLLRGPTFRVYTNADVIGAELGGALKNIIAIAVGACHELGLGHNAKGGLITRGLAEIARLGVAMGAQPSTFAGLAGLGDLIATCESPRSRNHQLGVQLARGLTLAESLERIGSTAEGVNTTAMALRLAAQHGLEMPITEQVGRFIKQEATPQQLITELMMREVKAEYA